MRQLFLLFLFSFSFLIPAMAGETRYSSIIDDLPLMSGMHELPDSAVMFDTPDGRIAETTARIRSGKKEVADFYDGALPALGWDAQNDKTYRREGETLTILFETGTDGTIVHFNLAPQSPK